MIRWGDEPTRAAPPHSHESLRASRATLALTLTVMVIAALLVLAARATVRTSAHVQDLTTHVRDTPQPWASHERAGTGGASHGQARGTVSGGGDAGAP